MRCKNPINKTAGSAYNQRVMSLQKLCSPQKLKRSRVPLRIHQGDCSHAQILRAPVTGKKSIVEKVLGRQQLPMEDFHNSPLCQD